MLFMNTSRKLLCSREQKRDKACLHTGVLACPVSRSWQQSPRSHSVSLNVPREDGWMLQEPACAARKLMPLLIQLLSYPMELMYPCLQSLPTEMEAKCWDFKMSFVQKLFFFPLQLCWLEGKKRLISFYKPCFAEKLRKHVCCVVYLQSFSYIFFPKNIFVPQTLSLF